MAPEIQRGHQVRHRYTLKTHSSWLDKSPEQGNTPLSYRKALRWNEGDDRATEDTAAVTSRHRRQQGGAAETTTPEAAESLIEYEVSSVEDNNGCIRRAVGKQKAKPCIIALELAQFKFDDSLGFYEILVYQRQVLTNETRAQGHRD